MGGIRKVLVVAADIMNCREVVRYGSVLAGNYGAELLVLHVEHDPFGAEGWNLPFLSFDEEYKAMMEDEKKKLAQVLRTETVSGQPVREIIRKGKPADTIRKVIEEEKIDLVVFPSHEETRLEHFLFGRITESIIRGMPCSILLVKTTPWA